jgi:hypothetical protein
MKAANTLPVAVSSVVSIHAAAAAILVRARSGQTVWTTRNGLRGRKAGGKRQAQSEQKHPKQGQSSESEPNHVSESINTWINGLGVEETVSLTGRATISRTRCCKAASPSIRDETERNPRHYQGEHVEGHLGR